MKKHTSIAEAQHKFQSWRSTKRAGERIPAELWSIVENLLDNPMYNKSSITKGLSISGEQLRTKFPSYFTSTNKAIGPEFVQASLAKFMPSTQSTSSFVIKRNDGVQMKICVSNNEQFSILIKLFME